MNYCLLVPGSLYTNSLDPKSLIRVTHQDIRQLSDVNRRFSMWSSPNLLLEDDSNCKMTLEDQGNHNSLVYWQLYSLPERTNLRSG